MKRKSKQKMKKEKKREKPGQKEGEKIENNRDEGKALYKKYIYRYICSDRLIVIQTNKNKK